jgi:hypothetical protein
MAYAKCTSSNWVKAFNSKLLYITFCEDIEHPKLQGAWRFVCSISSQTVIYKSFEFNPLMHHLL